MPEVIINTDGGARGNPGPAGAGIVIQKSGKVIAEIKKYLGDGKTNNWAEYEALIIGLTEAKKHGLSGKSMEIRMDSELIVKQMSGEYQVKEETLWPQYMKVHNLIISSFPDAKFVHVRRAENSAADKLVNEALDEAMR
jgi:ribonuclease HI